MKNIRIEIKGQEVFYHTYDGHIEKETTVLPLDTQSFMTTNTTWKEQLETYQAEGIEAIFVETDTASHYIKTRLQIEGHDIDVRQYLQERTALPVVAGFPHEDANIASYVQSEITIATWSLCYYGYESGKKEKSKEAMLTIGNGYLGVRGAMVETKSSESHYPGLYIARGFNKLETQIGDHMVTNEDFVNFPNFQFFTLKIGTEAPITPSSTNIKEIIRNLDFHTGIFETKMIIDAGDNRHLEIITTKVANMKNYHEVAICYQVTPLNFVANITILSEVDGTIINAGVDRYQNLSSQHLAIIATDYTEKDAKLLVETVTSKIKMQQDIHIRTKQQPETINVFEPEKGRICHEMTFDMVEGETYGVEKIVTIHTSLDDDVITLQDKDFATIQIESASVWQKLWKRCDIKITGDVNAQHLLRLHAYHLLVSASPNNIHFDAAVGARGLHGEAYRGHIFWDDIFIFPFYLLNFSEVAKQILMYRYHRLDAARAYAQEFGYEGAMFPWQSGEKGTEESQTLHLNPVSGKWDPDHSALQRHVSLAIAYNAIMYVHVTEDMDFLENYGAELIFEIARFWMSIAKKDEQTGRYSIDGVMGPDEFHEMYPGATKGGLKNNAYTNMMVTWLFEELPNICKKLGTAKTVDLFKRINYTPEMYQQTQEIKHLLTLDIQNDIIAQYEGFLQLKEIDLIAYHEKYGNVHRMDRILRAENQSADDYQVAKQADTLMTFYNLPVKRIDKMLADLGYQLSSDYLAKNLEYYLKRTSHGSTLSRIVHTQLAEMAGQRELAWDLYQSSLVSDYQDIQGGTTAEGIHTGVMAGTVYIALLTYAGIDYRQDLLTITPHLPTAWEAIAFGFDFKQTRFECNISKSTIAITSNRDVEVVIVDKKQKLKANQLMCFNTTTGKEEK